MASSAEQVVGHVIQVAGPAVDIQFPEGKIPIINTAIRITSEGYNNPTPIDIITEVAQHIEGPSAEAGGSTKIYYTVKPNHHSAYGGVLLSGNFRKRR